MAEASKNLNGSIGDVLRGGQNMGLGNLGTAPQWREDS